METARNIDFIVGQMFDFNIIDDSYNVRTQIFALPEASDKRLSIVSQYKGEPRHKEVDNVQQVYDFLKELHKVDFENSFVSSVLSSMLIIGTTKQGHVEKGKWVEGHVDMKEKE